MKYYTITVNGNTYNVSVEEGISAPTPVAAPVAQAPVASPATSAAAPVAAPAASETPAAAPVQSEGATKVSSPMPGKILAIKATAGKAIKKGEVILILEAMKMENEIVAPADGTVSSINVTVGQTVEAGTLLATLS